MKTLGLQAIVTRTVAAWETDRPAKGIDANVAVLRRIEQLGLPIIVGVRPFVSYKNAEFLHNEVPGMQIPQVRPAAGGAGA